MIFYHLLLFLMCILLRYTFYLYKFLFIICTQAIDVYLLDTCNRVYLQYFSLDVGSLAVNINRGSVNRNTSNGKVS